MSEHNFLHMNDKYCAYVLKVNNIEVNFTKKNNKNHNALKSYSIFGNGICAVAQDIQTY